MIKNNADEAIKLNIDQLRKYYLLDFETEYCFITKCDCDFKYGVCKCNINTKLNFVHEKRLKSLLDYTLRLVEIEAKMDENIPYVKQHRYIYDIITKILKKRKREKAKKEMRKRAINERNFVLWIKSFL
jgi:hypothetical protein